MAPRIYGSSRELLLDACERVLLRNGFAGLSVDAVVREAALTKGALFHHFASKDELLGALIERLSAAVGVQIAALAAKDREPVGRVLRAQIELTFTMADAERERMRALVIALMHAVATSPTVAARAREVNEAALAGAAAAGVSKGNALIVQLALDGYWLDDTGGVLRLDAGERAALRDSLRALTRPSRRKRKKVQR